MLCLQCGESPRLASHCQHRCMFAGAVGSFYWAGGNKEKMPAFPVGAAMWNTFIYHLGSIAFGSLIIAILQFVRCAPDPAMQHLPMVSLIRDSGSIPTTG